MSTNADLLFESISLEQAVDGIICDLSQAVDDHGQAVLAVCGGRSPLRLFFALSKTDLAWEKVIITLVDDRDVPADHPDSNQKLIAEHLLKNRAARAQWQNLPDFEGARVDVVILGIGEDGHFASLFPAMLNDVVAFDSSHAGQIIHTPPLGIPLHPRISMNIAMLAAAGRIVLLIGGEKKAGILRRAVTDVTLPIHHLLRLEHPRFDIVRI